MLVIALNSHPELTGIGKYVGEMTAYLAASSVSIRVIAAPPYYPEWRVQKGYSGIRYRSEVLAGVQIYRCPLWVPGRPRGLSRMLHQLSFSLSSLPVILWQAITWRPQIVFVVEPPLGCVPGSILAARLCGARTWLHVQDFEVDAAFDLGLLRANWLRRGMLAIERMLLRSVDRVSSISERMLDKLRSKGVDQDRIVYFPNWVDTQHIRPVAGANPLRGELGIPPDTRVALYSGNVGEKQGVESIVDVARRFDPKDGVLFLICGAGAALHRIRDMAAGLTNVRFIALQPAARINELMNLADLHLLPQRAESEDLVMPSKLGVMMASGRPVVACARPGSDVARAAAAGGVVVTPGQTGLLESAIRKLLGDSKLRNELGISGRAYAMKHWDRRTVLRRMLGEFGFQPAADAEEPGAAHAGEAAERGI